MALKAKIRPAKGFGRADFLMPDIPKLVQSLEIVGEQVNAGVFVRLHIEHYTILADRASHQLLPFYNGVGQRGDLDRTAILIIVHAEGHKQNRQQHYGADQANDLTCFL